MNILLVNPPFILSENSPYSKTGAILPPLGLLYIASYLKYSNPEMEINVLDSPAYKIGLEGFKKKLSYFNPDIVGISIYTTTFSMSLKTAESVKEMFPKAIVVAGGPHASILPEECLSSSWIDVVVIGEGERSFTELAQCVSRKDDLDKVVNIVYKKDGRIIHTRLDSANVDMDALPLPARDLVDMRLYHPAQGTYRWLPATNMITSRGCPFRCSFCSKIIFGSFYRTQSCKKTVKEIESLIRDYGIREIIFNDDVFTMDRKMTVSLCDMLVERDLDLTWSCSTRVNLVDKDILGKMREAGCISIGYGIESGDKDILKKIDKGSSLENAKKVIAWTKGSGIETRAFYILGFPGETMETIEKTIDASLELDADFVIYNFAIPLPGTELYEESRKNGVLLYDGVELYDRTDGAHPLIRLQDVPSETLSRLYNSAYRRYYIRPHYILNQFRHIKSAEDIARYLRGALAFFGWYGKINRNVQKRI
ncbi:MAG: radical SAM protein [Candidatus Omnitrophota bacterium]